MSLCYLCLMSLCYLCLYVFMLLITYLYIVILYLVRSHVSVYVLCLHLCCSCSKRSLWNEARWYEAQWNDALNGSYGVMGRKVAAGAVGVFWLWCKPNSLPTLLWWKRWLPLVERFVQLFHSSLNLRTIEKSHLRAENNGMNSFRSIRNNSHPRIQVNRSRTDQGRTLALCSLCMLPG